jgi:ABC-type glycerol-3-phosphate transport system permease component
MSGWRTQQRRDRTVRATLLTAALVVFLLPLSWTVLAALGLQANNNSTPPSIVGPLSLDHFKEVGFAEPSFWQELATSSISALCASALTTAVSFLAAYGLARSRFPGDRLLTQGFLVLASLPAMAYVIPLSDLMRRAHLVDSLVGLVLIEAAVTAPLATYVLYGALSELPTEWEEAAWLDGAGLLRVIGRVVLPLVAPSVAATAIIIFVLDWNLLLVPLVLTAGELKTVPVAMMDFFTFERELDWPTAAAALVISLAPVAILIMAFHRVLDRFSLTVNQRDGNT